MNAAPTASAERHWPWHRWGLFIGLSFAIHVGFVFAFGDRRPIVPRASVNVPQWQFTTHRSEREQLDDPTLFALPHPNGFAGAAWLRPPPLGFAPYCWTEPPRLLALTAAQLGTTFLQHQETHPRTSLELEALPPPELMPLKTADRVSSTAQRSRPSLSGELAHLSWLNAPIDLPSWPVADGLTNSVVQVWVEADGQVLSPALLPPGSGSKAADQLALKLARTARLSPLPSAGAKAVRGTLIFEWQTLPPTNATPATP